MRDDEVEHVKEEQASKVTAPEIWREMLKTSSGRDKAFVSYMKSWIGVCADTLTRPENHAILPKGVFALPRSDI